MATIDTSGRIGIDREDDEQAVIEAFCGAAREMPTDGNALDAVAALLGGTASWPGADMQVGPSQGGHMAGRIRSRRRPGRRDCR